VDVLIKVRKVCESPFKDALEAWNKGFADYYSPIQLTVDQFSFRFGLEELSPAYSFVAYYNGEPVGIIMNGIKSFAGRKWAWNGGTSVARAYRRLGVGKALMKATMNLYEHEEVDIACLEAFKVNDKAIALYKAYGYDIVDHLLFLEHTGPLDEKTFTIEGDNRYSVQHGTPQQVSRLPFYNTHVPWRTQWKFIRNGESVIVQNEHQKDVGYALYQHKFDEDGKINTVTLYQCVADENEQHQRDIIHLMLAYIFPGHAAYKKTTYNLPASNRLLVDILNGAGFTEAYTSNGAPFEQVFMTKIIDSV
jgi:GNAT superfamily N-acetyltransferase